MTGENVGHPEGSNVRGGPSMGGGLAPPAGPTRTPGGVRVASTQLQGWSRDAGPAAPPPRCPLSAPGTGSGGARRPGGSRGPQQLRKELNRGLQVAPLGPAGLRGVKSAERGAEGGEAVRRRQGLSPEFRGVWTALASPSQESIHSPFGSDRLGLVSVVFFKTIPTTIKR